MRFRTAILWNGVSIMGSSGISLLSTIILARLLTPADFAIIGIVTIFIVFSQMMVDSEMGGALLRKKTVDRLDYSTLFYYNLAVSIAIYAILYFTAPIIADFYDKAELIDVIRIISFTILIHAFRVVQRIIIFRNLKYKVYALINLLSGIISLIVAIIMALRGFSYWALVWQQVIGALCNVIFLCLNTRFVPVLKFSVESFKYQFCFGISLMGSDIIRTIANNISTNIIAKISSMTFAGYYTQTSRLSNFTQSTFGSLMDQTIFPMLSKLKTYQEVKNKYFSIIKYVFWGVISITIVLEILSHQIIHIALGSQWTQATWMFQLLCIAILPATIQVLCRNILKTTGETNKVLYLEMIKSSLLILSLLLGIPYGDSGVIIGLIIGQFIGAIIWIIVTQRSLSKDGELKK